MIIQSISALTSKRYLILYSAISLSLIVLLSFGHITSGSAQASDPPVRLARIFEAADAGLSHPAGLAFSSRANHFLVAEAPGQGQPPAGTRLIQLTPRVEQSGSTRLAANLGDPINLAFDDRQARLLLLPSPAQLLEVPLDSQGDLDPGALTQHDLRSFGLQDPQGMSVDPASGAVFILDAYGPKIVRLNPGTGGSLDQAAVSTIPLHALGTADVRGLAFDPSTGHLQVFSPGNQKLYELSQSGQILATRSLAGFGLVHPLGITFAPSSDRTDNPAQISLFIADSGEIPGQAPAAQMSSASPTTGTAAANSTSGQIVELSFVPLPAAPTPDFYASLVRTVDTSLFSQPSPDPSGIAYLPNSHHLIISDGEVEETVNHITHFEGANVWELTLDGTVVYTTNVSSVSPVVVKMTNEPTGVAWNPNNGHFYFTDDDAKEVYDLDPGSDGQINAGDTFTHFDTAVAGNGDTEGIGFDFVHNRMYVADGGDMEVYVYDLSGNPLAHFDVAQYGIADPESVEYNADSDTLFVLSSNRSSPYLIETDLEGNLLTTIDISAANAVAAAGVAYAPASNGSGAKHFYIVDRGVDNNPHPNENDGKLYEMTAPSSVGNQAPTAVDDTYSTDENTDLSVAAPGVLDNDSDPDGDSLTAGLGSEPSHGTLTLNANGSFTYSPNAGFSGSDSFTYRANDGLANSNLATVTITVTPVNNAPVAENDSYSTAEDTALNIAAPGVLENDSDPDGDPLTAVLKGNASHGTLTLNADGSFSYTPNANFNGSDSFTYRANDGTVDSNTATVSITVTPANDAPVAGDDNYSTAEDTPLVIPAPGVLENDTDIDGDPLSAVLNADPSHGMLTLSSDGSFSYTPNANFHGADSFSYHANDGTMDSNIATVIITVTPVNDAPVAENDSYSTGSEKTLAVPAPGVLGNDSDPDGDALTAVLDASATHGSVTLNADGSFSYTPQTNFSGTDSFTYHAADGKLDSNSATVTLTVGAANQTPVAVDDAYTVNEDTALDVAAPGVLANDNDADGDTLAAVLDSPPGNGMLTLNTDGSFTYTPNAHYNGIDSFTYHATDGTADSNSATVNLTIKAANNPPKVSILAPWNGAIFDQGEIISFSGTASDLEDGDLTASLTWSSDLDGVIGAGGSFTATLSKGTHTITASVTDSTGAESAAQITITITQLTRYYLPLVSTTEQTAGASGISGAEGGLGFTHAQTVQSPERKTFLRHFR